MKVKSFIGFGLLIGFTVMLFFSFGDQVGGYMDFAQAEAANSKAHVVGDWVDDKPTQYDREANVFSFHMEDEEGHIREVHYNNPKPTNFEDAEQLVVEGQIENGTFQAEHILVKCPSKYNDSSNIEKAEASEGY